MQLSPSWAVYWEYVAKVRGYARSQGRTEFPRGSELNAALRVWAEHGVVTADDYSGILAGCEIRDDRPLYAELRGLLQSARSARNWDEQALVSNARAILDRHMGPPPEQAMLDGRPLGPHACLHELGIEPGRYVCLMSLMEQPWHTWALLPVPDNWWASRGYYNLPAEEFTRMLRDAAEAGVTVGLCMDTSGPGYCFREGVAVVPSFDIAETGIDDAARQVRFTDGSTTDDHAVHLVGHTRRGDRTWYLIKDSGTKPRNGPHPGYSFYDQDYLSLKCLSAMLPRESVERSLGRPLGPCPE